MQCKKCKRFFKNAGTYSIHVRSCKLTDIDLQNILNRYMNGESTKDLSKEYPHHVVLYVTKGKRRSVSDAGKMAHKRKPDSFRHSDDTKEKMSKSRLKYMKDNPQNVAWKRSDMSYPEKVFQILIKKHQLRTLYDIVYEYSVFPFYVDFAFVNIKLAVEIDGAQHYTIQSKIDRDKRKDELLLSQGWKIYRIPAFKLQKEFDNVEKMFLEYLKSFKNQPKLFKFDNDIIMYKQIRDLKKQEKKKRREDKSQQRKNQIKFRKKLLLESDIDFTKFGWIKQAAKLFNITPQKTALWIRRNSPDFYKSCFKINRK